MSKTFYRVNELSEITGRPRTVLAVGVFDGVHLGHQHLLKQMIASAASVAAIPAVLTFFPHPARFIQGHTGRYYLSTLDERVRLLHALGIELVITHPFDHHVRQIRAEAFVDNLLQAMNPVQMWGGNFSIGYNREGNADYLATLGRQKGFTVHQIETKLVWNDAVVSSSRIRRSLASGDIADVNSCLARPFTVAGEVKSGFKRGRTIGFPTANLKVWSEKALPANGVYATIATVDGASYPAATNVGIRPTVSGDSEVTVEAHLLDFARDLYGKRLELAFVNRVRDEKKFDSIAALKAQIARDVDQIRALLTHRSH